VTRDVSARIFFAILSALFLCLRSEGAERVWHAEKGFRWAELNVPAGGKTGFTLLKPEQTGLAFTNALTAEAGISLDQSAINAVNAQFQ
jgi:hypothetical protein